MKRHWLALFLFALLAIAIVNASPINDNDDDSDIKVNTKVARPRTSVEQLAERRKKIDRIAAREEEAAKRAAAEANDDVIISPEEEEEEHAVEGDETNIDENDNSDDNDVKRSKSAATKLKGAAKGKKSTLDTIDNDAYVHFFSAFVASFSIIIGAEIGDKTFFIAAVMAMKHNRWEVFFSAISALALMTVLSAAAGNILPNLLSPTWTHYASMVLFFFFGFKLLKQGWETDPVPKKNEELEEVEEELERSEHEAANPAALEAGQQRSLQNRIQIFARKMFSPVFIQGFTMTFLAEWGDRSQIATIALAAARDPVGVTLGGILGHSICTGGAVLSGKFAASRISERHMAYFGGACFLLCGLYSLYSGPDTAASFT